MNSINERISGFEETITGNPFEVVAREDVAGDPTQARNAAKKDSYRTPGCQSNHVWKRSDCSWRMCSCK